MGLCTTAVEPYHDNLLQVDAYLADPETMTTNRMIATAYKDGLKRGLFIQPTSYPHFFKNKADLVMYSPQPLVADGGSQGASGEDRTQQQKANM